MHFPSISQKRRLSVLFFKRGSGFLNGEENQPEAVAISDNQRFSARVIIWALTLAAVALTVFGAKVLLIANYGSFIPFLDQWDGEAAGLYLPYLKSQLSFPRCSLPTTSTASYSHAFYCWPYLNFLASGGLPCK